MFKPEQIKALEAKLDPKHVTQRTQSGRTLDYIEGWQAIAEANRIFGFDGWDRQTVKMTELRRDEVTDKYGKPQWRVGYMSKVRIIVKIECPNEDPWIVMREGTGFGSGAMGDLGEAIESAIKEAETDAMKRALMTFGNPFGLALYDKSKANVGIDEPAFTPAKSSASLKKAGSWEALKAELDSDFADCHSVVSLGRLRADYREKAINQQWPKAWLEALKNEFDGMEDALSKTENMMAGE